MQVLRVGIIGVGRLGSLHLEHLLKSPLYKVVGCYDNNPKQLERISEDYPVDIYNDADALIHQCDVVDIVTPAASHFYYAEKALRLSKHVFIEKPMTEDIDEAERIVTLAREANVKVQVGHIERFNPAFSAIKNLHIQPMFIEGHRLAPFDPRGTDVSVVLDLMIHDIDLVLSLVKANIKNISANGVAVISKQPDIANARIEFDNGCVANLTASRVSMQKMRKLRLFQKNTYISLDFIQREAEMITLETENQGNSIPLHFESSTKYVSVQQLDVPEHDALKLELEAFARSILQHTEPEVTAEDGIKALQVAHRIIDKIKRNGGF